MGGIITILQLGIFFIFIIMFGLIMVYCAIIMKKYKESPNQSSNTDSKNIENMSIKKEDDIDDNDPIKKF